MARSAYLSLSGQHQGEIEGSVTQKGREKSILVHAFDHEIVSPRDPISGLATGKRQHKPIKIVKEIDKSSPRLYQALVTNENLIHWVLKFWEVEPGSAGLERQVYTITLTNASIASICEYMVDNDRATTAALPLHEAITFTYQKIQWEWNEGAIIAQDDWSTPIV